MVDLSMGLVKFRLTHVNRYAMNGVIDKNIEENRNTKA